MHCYDESQCDGLFEVDGRGIWSRLLGVKDRIIRSSVDDFSALSWESVGIMFVLKINSIFW